jgi:hypothetical protein
MAAIAERIGFVSASLGRGLSLGARRCCLAGSSGSFDSLAVAQRFNCLFFFLSYSCYLYRDAVLLLLVSCRPFRMR